MLLPMDRMDWSNGDLSREDLPKLIKGFIDVLILASGYQSSGRLAHWDSTNIKKAFRWALFLEDVFRCLKCSDDYKEYMEPINAALSEIKSTPYFPQGLRNVSLLDLGRAKVLLLKQFLQTLPLRDSNFRATVTAITEMDIIGIQRISDHFLDVYIDKLFQYASNSTLTCTKCYMEDSSSASPEDTRFMKAGSFSDCDFTKIAVQELGKRHLQCLCVAAAETGLDVLSKITGKSNWNEFETTAYGDRQQNAAMSIEENPIEPLTWNEWKSRSLSYLLNKRTARLASGAKLFFSAPKHQWTDVIERLHISDDSDDDMLEKIEILLLGRIVHKWSLLIKILVSNSYKSITISKLRHEVQNLPLQQLQNCFSKEDLNLEDFLLH